MIELMPIGVLLLFAVVSVLGLGLIPILWGIVRSVKRGARKTAVTLVILAVAIVAFSVCAVISQAPKGARTIAELNLPDGHQFLVRHYRFGWLEYPMVRFYVREPGGTWTSFILYSELIDPNNTSLTVDSAKTNVTIGKAGGWYPIREKYIVHVDGPGDFGMKLAAGVEPGEEDIYRFSPDAR